MNVEKSKLTHEAWYELLLASLSDSSLKSPFGDSLPGFPGDELQRNTTSLSGIRALEQANDFYVDVSHALERSNNPIQPGWRIVDFGSCWGRICRFFMRDVPLDRIQGVDVEPGFVDECNRLFNSSNFSVCPAIPPSTFKDSSINLISAYSVFSHLSEAAFMAWMMDFRRVLKPGGFVAFTSRSEPFFRYCESLRDNGGELSSYQKALGDLVPGIGDFNERFESGDFIFVTQKGVAGGGAMNESFYGETFVSPSYVEKHLGSLFEITEFKKVGAKYDQSLFVLKKI